LVFHELLRSLPGAHYGFDQSNPQPAFVESQQAAAGASW